MKEYDKIKGGQWVENTTSSNFVLIVSPREHPIALQTAVVQINLSDNSSGAARAADGIELDQPIDRNTNTVPCRKC